MEMNVNRELIKELRLKRSWSQEKLADVAGVSMRTVQRVETDGVASLQSRIAIARALEVEPVDLDIESEHLPSSKEGVSAEAGQVVPDSLAVAWSSYFWPGLRFGILAILWVGMLLTAFLFFMTLVSGVFFWEATPFTYWQSVGNGIIGAMVFVPVFLVFYYLYRYLKRPKSIGAVE